jgi:hypothetical protein
MERKLTLSFPLVALVFVAGCRSIEDRTPPTHEQVKSVEQFLFVMNARSGTFDGERLTFENIAPIIFFSDRPYRVFGHTKPAKFVEAWNRGPNSFAEDPPNAILSVMGDSYVDSTMVTLSDPKFADGDFSYKVTVDDGKIPEKFGESSLFIDNNLWAAVGGFAAGHVLARRSEARRAAAYSAGASARQTSDYYYHATPPPPPKAPPPPQEQPKPPESVPDLLARAISGMETYCKGASETNANYVKQLINTLKAVDDDFKKVAKTK